MGAPREHEGRRRPSARELLRAALVDDEDPRLPWWLPLPGLLGAIGWAGYQAATGAGGFLATALWPGAAVFLLATLVTWFGWQLDID
ncbi:MAG: hypothetical protein FJZ92_07565 [Chloroflexi bacterium]|nr:hypothetical protein [Chloroflexota bacterium]